ncbi:hypothetical protein OGAPHI_001473 [Ogataea philodendri]|uniref:Uncharacterized protein n=1 Tax=Ogataea philodendri TaxID=1378263 RepID=A0A9P8PCI7_9ASCO|nr:uncharacterized protein OGAPHI_001473 [Ogataea philodendri]KAH3669352.1 hypothetical protein OGAPHI_001473 [Ogataea philodendri]
MATLESPTALITQVVTVVVTQVVVRGNGAGSDTGIHQELGQNRLHFGLATLEVVSSNKGVVLVSKLNKTRNKSVLRTSVDVWNILQDTGNGENGTWSNLLVVLLHSFQNVLGSVVHTFHHINVSLGVSSPQHNNFVELVGRLEVADILSDLLHVAPLAGGVDLAVGSVEAVVGSLVLVGSNEVWVRVERSVHVQTVGVDTQLDSGGLGDRSIVVGVLQTFLGVELDLVLVGKHGSHKCGTVVTAQSNKHHTNFRHLKVNLELVWLLHRLDRVSSGRLFVHNRVLVHVVGDKLVLRVLAFVGLNFNFWDELDSHDD